jgi:PleD family two-component response regulator
VPLTASVGYAVLTDDEAPDDLVRRADAALYEAKAAGRNAVRGPATLPRRT